MAWPGQARKWTGIRKTTCALRLVWCLVVFFGAAAPRGFHSSGLGSGKKIHSFTIWTRDSQSVSRGQTLWSCEDFGQLVQNTGRQGNRVELNTIREHIDYDISVSQSSGTLDVWCVEVCSSQFTAEDRTPWRCWLFWSLTVLMGYIVRFWIKGWNSEIHVWWIYLNQQSKDQLINYWLENRIILKLIIYSKKMSWCLIYLTIMKNCSIIIIFVLQMSKLILLLKKLAE